MNMQYICMLLIGFCSYFTLTTPTLCLWHKEEILILAEITKYPDRSDSQKEVMLPFSGQTEQQTKIAV